MQENFHIYYVDNIPIPARSPQEALMKFEILKQELKSLPVGWFAGEPIYNK